MSIKIYHNKSRDGSAEFTNTHENEQYQKLVRMLIDKYGPSRQPVLLIPNFCDCDAILVKQDAFIILEFKHYGGELTMIEDESYLDPSERDTAYKFDTEQRWVINGNAEVKGGSDIKGIPKNPFRQCRINKRNISFKLSDHFDRSATAPSTLVCAIVVFDQPVSYDLEAISPKARSWFKITDMDHLSVMLDCITNSPTIFHYTQEDILSFPGAFKFSKERLMYPVGKKVQCTITCDSIYKLYIDGSLYYTKDKYRGYKIDKFNANQPFPIQLEQGTYLFKFEGTESKCLLSKVYTITDGIDIYAELSKVKKNKQQLIAKFTETVQKPLVMNIAGVDFEMCMVEGTSDKSMKDFMLSRKVVTKKLWNAVVKGSALHKSNAATDDTPVTDISWDDCMAFIHLLNQLSPDEYRLPTSAEWEYAARGGNKGESFTYAGSNDSEKVAWYRHRSENLNPGGLLEPNSLQLNDMSGNVWEYCSDLLDYIPDVCVACGGSWLSPREECVPTSRAYFPKQFGNHVTGFRLALTRLSSTPIP